MLYFEMIGNKDVIPEHLFVLCQLVMDIFHNVLSFYRQLDQYRSVHQENNWSNYENNIIWFSPIVRVPHWCASTTAHINDKLWTGIYLIIPGRLYLHWFTIYLAYFVSMDLSRTSTAKEQVHSSYKLDRYHILGWKREEAAGALLPRADRSQYYKVEAQNLRRKPFFKQKQIT